MARTVVIDAVELVFRVPADLPDPEVVKVYQLLRSARFTRRLRRAIRAVLARYAELVTVTFTVRR
jgi:hypothetical protein